MMALVQLQTNVEEGSTQLCHQEHQPHQKIHETEQLLSNTYLPSIWHPLERCLQLHPKYNHVFGKAIDQLFYGRGPMAVSHRHFVALMAASRHNCHFLMQIHREEFKRLGGNGKWLRGLEYVPNKISSLDNLSTVLAHQPWSITIDHLIALTKCASPSNWSLNELLQAVIVLTQTHVLCSFVLGNGDDELHNTYTGSEEGTTNRIHAAGEVEQLLQRMNDLRNTQNATEEQGLSEQQLQEYFMRVHDAAVPNGGTSALSAVRSKISGSESSLYTKDTSFCYEDFAIRARNGHARTHKIHEVSWEDHGYSCLDELYNEMADILDKKFTLTQNLTYFTMGGYNDVDTSKYRTAIWMYIQSLYGIRHNDYNYAEVNVMLSRDMKKFIKTICCFPETTTSELRQSVMVEFKPSEKVHVLLMIMEARLQAELIHFFRALIRLNNSSANR